MSQRQQDCPLSPPGSSKNKYEEFQNETLGEEDVNTGKLYILSDPNQQEPVPKLGVYTSEPHLDERKSEQVNLDENMKNMRSSINSNILSEDTRPETLK